MAFTRADDKMEPSCIDLYVFAGQSNVLGWGVGPLEMQRVLSAHRRLAGGAPDGRRRGTLSSEWRSPNGCLSKSS